MKKHCEARWWAESRQRMIDRLEIHTDEIDLDMVYRDVMLTLAKEDFDTARYDRELIDTMVVNMIRHEFTSYDKDLDRMNRSYHKAPKGEKEMTYIMYRNEVLDQISKLYPSLANSCEQQKWPMTLLRK